MHCQIPLSGREKTGCMQLERHILAPCLPLVKQKGQLYTWCAKLQALFNLQRCRLLNSSRVARLQGMLYVTCDCVCAPKAQGCARS